MFTLDQLREAIEEVQYGKRSLADFEDWFVEASWNVHQWGLGDLPDLTFRIEEILTRYQGGFAGEAPTVAAIMALAEPSEMASSPGYEKA